MVFQRAQPIQSAVSVMRRVSKLAPDIRATMLLPSGEEDTLLRDATRPSFLRTIREGGKLEFRAGGLEELAKADFATETAWEQAIEEIFDQPYWQGINQSTRDALEIVLSRSVNEGLSIRETSRLIAEDTHHVFDDVRSELIARTETTAILGFGQHVARDRMITDGIVDGMTWLTTPDNRRRPDHENAEGQVVSRRTGQWIVSDAAGNQIGTGPEFMLGQERARFPGDPKLSAALRLNCRCHAINIPAGL